MSHGAEPAGAEHGEVLTSHAAEPADAHHDAPAETVAAFVPAEPLPDASAEYDRLGLVRRSSTLLAESERLRDALAPLVTSGN